VITTPPYEWPTRIAIEASQHSLRDSYVISQRNGGRGVAAGMPFSVK
jgi:hypothetical protein